MNIRLARLDLLADLRDPLGLTRPSHTATRAGPSRGSSRRRGASRATRRFRRLGSRAMATTDLELGGLPGAPPPPRPTPRATPAMQPGDVVLLEMNGDKWAFVNLKRDQCVPPSPRRRPTAPLAPLAALGRARDGARRRGRSPRAVPPRGPPAAAAARLTRRPPPRSPTTHPALLASRPLPRTACIGKHRAVSLNPLLGAPFGSCYEVTPDGVLYPARRDAIGDWDTRPSEDHRSNETIFDRKDHSAQALTHDDIARMKRSGAEADEIVERLCAGSATFEAKTAFAQEKYKKKKLRKHVVRVVARQPSARWVCEAYFHKQPSATGSLRYDALAMLLASANVGAGARPLVVERCGGAVLAAVAERCGGLEGARVVAAHAGGRGTGAPGYDIARMMNLSEEARAAIATASLGELIDARDKAEAADGEDGEGDEEPGGGEAGGEGASKAPDEKAPASGASAPASEDASAPASASAAASSHPPSTKPPGWVSKRLAPATRAALASLSAPSEGFTSLVLAAPDLDPGPVLRRTLPLLAPSAPFAAWFPAAQPLAEALHALRSAGAAVNLSMHEPWLRKHQVLPGRTHPTMTTDAGAGGFVLSGNRVLTKEEEERAERRASREKEDDVTRPDSAEGGAEEAGTRGGGAEAEEEDARGPESAEAAARRAEARKRKRARDEHRGAGGEEAGEEQPAGEEPRPEGPARRASTRSKTR